MIFFFLRTADGIVVIPDQLDDRIVGFRSRIHEKYLRHRSRRDAQELFRKFDAYIDRFMSKGMVKRQL